MARAIWKGVIRFGSVDVPVRLFPAVEDRGVHFRLLHEKDGQAVQQHMVNPATDEVVPKERIRKGFAVDSGVFVMLEDNELSELEPEPSRDIEILRFVKPAVISHQWYERPYYLGPDGENGAYFALARALGHKKLEGVARWTMRKRTYHGALCARANHLLLITIRHAEEIVLAEALDAPEGRKLDQREVTMARQLVSALEGPFDPSEFRDEYRDKVMELIEAKARGEKIPMRAAKKKRETERGLADVLQASLKNARKKEKAVA
jgi:DNA end-binding protein Ku